MAQERNSRKSALAFRTISEVSQELDVPQHVLRFWESRFSQVRPLKRAGRRRYYRPEDIALLRQIRDLLYQEGLTIKGVQKLFRENGGRLLEKFPPAARQGGCLALQTLAKGSGMADDHGQLGLSSRQSSVQGSPEIDADLLYLSHEVPRLREQIKKNEEEKKHLLIRLQEVQKILMRS